MAWWRNGALSALVLGLALALCRDVAAAERPNVVILLADDLGWARVGYNNPAMVTPNIGRSSAT